MRTRLPDGDVGRERGGTDVVEAAVDGRDVGDDPDQRVPVGLPAGDGPPARPTRPGQRPSACFSSSARAVSSQVNSLSARPKWP